MIGGGAGVTRVDAVKAGGPEFEDDRGGFVRRAVVNGHNGDHRSALAGGDGDVARQQEIIHPIGGGPANGIGDGQAAVGWAVAADSEEGALGTAVGEVAANGGRSGPILPRGRAGRQAQPRPAIGALNGDRVGGDDADNIGQRRWWRGREDGDLHWGGAAHGAPVVGSPRGERIPARRGVAPDQQPIVGGNNNGRWRRDRAGTALMRWPKPRLLVPAKNWTLVT